MIDPSAAWERLAAHLAPLPTVELDRRRAAGRVLAEPLTATLDVPGVDVSAMDGYALTAAVREGDRLPVTGRIAAGDAPGRGLADGETARIMTGAPVPATADRVAPVELTDGGDREVVFHEGVPAGAHIRRRGEIVRRGRPLLEAGAPLTPGALALLATHGYRTVPVHRPPRVAVLVTGDEVVPPEAEPAAGQLRDSHTDFLLAAGRSLGLELAELGIVGDQRQALDRRVREGLEADVLLVTGGVSKGEFDFVEDVFRRAGCEVLFDSVAMQPGKPLIAARHAGGFAFGLPGNPASVMVAFWLFVRPTLRRLEGHADGYWHGALEGRLAAPLPGAKGRDRFLAAEVGFAGGRLRVKPVPPRGSHDLAAYARGSALVRVPAHAAPALAGARCEVLPLADWRGVILPSSDPV